MWIRRDCVCQRTIAATEARLISVTATEGEDLAAFLKIGVLYRIHSTEELQRDNKEQKCPT